MSRLHNFLKSVLDPRVYVHGFRVLHFYNYSHVEQLRKLHRGSNVTFAPNVSFRNAERIWIGDGSHIGEYSTIWAGNSIGKVIIGNNALFAGHVTLTASNYGVVVGAGPIMDQPKSEQDIIIGDDVWLGANVVVLAGVSVGTGAVVGAGAVVTKDLPANAIAVGVPARVVSYRPGSA